MNTNERNNQIAAEAADKIRSRASEPLRQRFIDLVTKVAGRMAKDHCLPLPEVWEPELDAILSEAHQCPNTWIKSAIEKAREPLLDCISDARVIIERTISVMTEEQAGQVAGIRSWLEQAPYEIEPEGGTY